MAKGTKVVSPQAMAYATRLLRISLADQEALHVLQTKYTNTFIFADSSRDIITSTLIEDDYGFRLVSLPKQAAIIPPVKNIAVDAEYHYRSRTPLTLQHSVKAWVMKLLYQVCNYDALEEVTFVHMVWNQEFADLMNCSYFKDAYRAGNHWVPNFDRLADANMTISTLPDVCHITQAEFEALYL